MSRKPRYADLAAKLQAIVEQLDKGELGLEDALDRFTEGVQLVRQGEQMLKDAERRIEVLLSEEGKTEPLDKPKAAEDDVPF